MDTADAAEGRAGQLEEMLASNALAMETAGAAEGRAGQLDEMLEKVGEPFSPGTANESQVGGITRALPRDSVYGNAILLWLNALPETRATDFFLHGNGALPLLLSYLIQTTLAAYLMQSVVEAEALDASCSSGSPLLRAVATCTFALLGLRDLVESYEIHLWLGEFRTVPAMELLRFQRCSNGVRGVHVHTHLRAVGLAQTVGRYLDRHPRALAQYGSGAAVTRPVSGITARERAAFYVCIIGGKVAVALLVLLSGSGRRLFEPGGRARRTLTDDTPPQARAALSVQPRPHPQRSGRWICDGAGRARLRTLCEPHRASVRLQLPTDRAARCTRRAL